MTGTDLYVNKPHCAAAVRPWEREKPQPPPSLLLGLQPVQSCLGVARVMSEQKVPRSVEQRIVIKFLGENVPSAEIHHRLQQQYCCWSSNPSRREGGGCGFTLSRSHSCCAVRLVYIQISPGHIWTTLYMQLSTCFQFCPVISNLTYLDLVAVHMYNTMVASAPRDPHF